MKRINFSGSLKYKWITHWVTKKQVDPLKLNFIIKVATRFLKENFPIKKYYISQLSRSSFWWPFCAKKPFLFPGILILLFLSKAFWEIFMSYHTYFILYFFMIWFSYSILFVCCYFLFLFIIQSPLESGAAFLAWKAFENIKSHICNVTKVKVKGSLV